MVLQLFNYNVNYSYNSYFYTNWITNLHFNPMIITVIIIIITVSLHINYIIKIKPLKTFFLTLTNSLIFLYNIF